MDEISTSTLWIVLAILVMISAYFSGTETGMMSVNKYRLKHLEKDGHSGALRVASLLRRPDRLIGLILIGNNLVNIAASSIATVIGMRLFGDVGIVYATFALTFIILIFAEVTPKTLAALHPERVAFPSSILLAVLLKLLFPFVVLLNWITNGILALIGVSAADREQHSLSSEELRTVVNEAGALIPQKHQDMLVSVLDLENLQVEDIMIPRNEIAGIDINDDWKSISRQLTRSVHTRILLYRDTIDDVVGFIHVRDAFRMLSKGEISKASLLRSVKKIYFIPEGTPLNVQLIKFQRAKERIGLVVDEYGDIQGLVTIDDILEDIVGDFTTTMTPTASEEVISQQDGSFLVEGSATIRDLNKAMNWLFPTDGPKTLNGLILEYLEEIPEANISLRLAGYPIEIIEVKDNMIKTVRVMPNLRV